MALDVAPLVRRENIRAVLVADTSALFVTPHLPDWNIGVPTLLAIPTVVVGELDRCKEKPPEARARAARAVARCLADATTKGSMRSGVLISDKLWACTAAADKATMPPELDSRVPDHQIVATGWSLAQELPGAAVVLVTRDHNQAVAASSIGLTTCCFHGDEPFTEDDRRDLIASIDRARDATLLRREPIPNNLPPKETIVTHFVGRDDEMERLFEWLESGRRKWALVGEGGKGKSALAYELAERVALGDISSELFAVVWLSAKKRRFVEGKTVSMSSPDFSTLEEALERLLDFYRDSAVSGDSRDRVLSWLSEYPTLLVVDDIDSIPPENADVVEFFSDDILHTKSRVLFTSRRSQFGLEGRQTQVHGLKGEEATRFVNQKASEFAIDPGRLQSSMEKLINVTEGSPLYIEDLLRLCHVLGVGDAIKQWSERRGEAARRYALEVEIERLQDDYPLGLRVLVACAVCDVPASADVLTKLLNVKRDDVEDALEHLRKYYLLPEAIDVEGVPSFALTRNTRSLVLTKYSDSHDAEQIRGALTAIGWRPPTPGENQRLDEVFLRVHFLVQSRDFDGAESLLVGLDHDYPNRPQILQMRGWLYKRWEPPRCTDAAELFQRAHDLNYSRRDLYWHWSEVEELQRQWKAAAEVAEKGLVRVGEDVSLMFRAARARLRLAQYYLSQFATETAYEEFGRVIELARRGARQTVQTPHARRALSRLFEVGMQAARRRDQLTKNLPAEDNRSATRRSTRAAELPRGGARANELPRMRSLWEEKLPDDDYRHQYA